MTWPVVHAAHMHVSAADVVYNLGVASSALHVLRSSNTSARMMRTQLTLGHVSYFEHGRSCTLWLGPGHVAEPRERMQPPSQQPSDDATTHSTRSPDGDEHADEEGGLPALMQLQAALFAAFPECHDLNLDPGRGISRFVPHLSLGQTRSRREAEALAQVGF